MNHLKKNYSSDKAAVLFLVLAMSYLLAGLLFGVLGGMQYLLPAFLKEKMAFQKTRPLHVYLVISWIFTAAQGCLYYFIPRLAGRRLIWKNGIWVHLIMQLFLSSGIVIAFFLGYFSGREYLEFPAWFGIIIIASWIPLALNFFGTVRPRYKTAPVYIWSWSAGLIFFFITMSEAYLWIFDYFQTNIIRDITVQWKALGSMVGSWNMLIYGSSIFIMEKVSGQKGLASSRLAFFFFFLGLTNLMFNWGHHTYIVPAAPWIKSVSYTISMTELLILGHIIFKWRKTLSNAQKNFHDLSYRLLSFADLWIFLNLTLAILISIPAVNRFTHGTHITVAHAMGATIGINTMLLFACIFYIVKQYRPAGFIKYKGMATPGIAITNIALIFFWAALIGNGMIKIGSKINSEPFQKLMQKSIPLFKVFTFSGLFIMLGLLLMILSLLRSILHHPSRSLTEFPPREMAAEGVLSGAD